MSVSVCMCSIQADCYPSFGLVSLASCVREGESWGLVPPTAKNTPGLHTLQGCILQGGGSNCFMSFMGDLLFQRMGTTNRKLK